MKHHNPVVYIASASSAALLLAGLNVPAVAAEPIPVQRLAGSSGVETSLAVAKHTWGDKWDVVYVASNRNPVDALPAATIGDGPVVLTDGNTLNLGGVKPRQIVILGGTGAVPTGIENQAKTLGTEVTRLAGKDRNQTAFEIAKRWVKIKGTPKTVGVTRNTGTGSPDAVAASILRNMPILTFTDTASAGNLKAMAAELGADRVLGLGGTAVVPDATLNNTAGNHSRLAGADRYETAYNIAKHAIREENRGGQTVYLTSGTALKDAMVAGANRDGVILLTSPGTIEKTKGYLKELGTKQLIAVGGQKVLPNDVIDAIRGITVQPKPQQKPGGVYTPGTGEDTTTISGWTLEALYADAVKHNVPAHLIPWYGREPWRAEDAPLVFPSNRPIPAVGPWQYDKRPGQYQEIVTNPPQFPAPKTTEEDNYQGTFWAEYHYNQWRIKNGLQPIPWRADIRQFSLEDSRSSVGKGKGKYSLNYDLLVGSIFPGYRIPHAPGEAIAGTLELNHMNGGEEYSVKADICRALKGKYKYIGIGGALWGDLYTDFAWSVHGVKTDVDWKTRDARNEVYEKTRIPQCIDKEIGLIH